MHLVGHLAEPVCRVLDEVLADGVVASRVVVGRILLSGNQLFRMKQLTIGAATYLVCENI